MMKKHFFLAVLFIASLSVTAKTIKPANPATLTANKKHLDEGVKITLVLDDKTYEIASYSLNYISKDKTATPAIPAPVNPLPYYNSVNNLGVTIRTSKIDQALLDWILSADRVAKEGKIIIVDSESGKTKTLTLKSIKPAGYTESFYNGSTAFPTMTTFNMHFEQISIKL